MKNNDGNQSDWRTRRNSYLRQSDRFDEIVEEEKQRAQGTLAFPKTPWVPGPYVPPCEDEEYTLP